VNDGRERLGIGVEPPQGCIQGDDQFVTERIELLGPVKSDRCILFATE
jgi:hypothetical protein